MLGLQGMQQAVLDSRQPVNDVRSECIVCEFHRNSSNHTESPR